MNITVETRLDRLAEISNEWDALAATQPRDGFFRTASWVIPWFRFVQPKGRPFVIVIRGGSGQLVGLAPLCLTTFVDLGFPLRVLGFAGREVVSGDYLDFLSLPHMYSANSAVLLDYVWSSRAEWDVLQLGELLDGCELQMRISGWASRNELPERQQEPRICPYIELPQTFDKYLETLGSSVRYSIRRRKRDLLEKNGCLISTCSSVDEIHSGLAIMTDLHVKRWRKEGHSGTLTRPGFQDFLKAVCVTPPQGGACKLYVMRREGFPVAALLAFHFADSALYYQAGWDPDSPLTRFSPGTVMMAHAIEDAIISGKRYYDFLRGDEAYKAQWTKSVRETKTLVCGRSLIGRGYIKCAALKDKAKHLFGKTQAPNSTDESIGEVSN